MSTYCRPNCPCDLACYKGLPIEADCNSVGKRAAYCIPTLRLALEVDPADVLRYERPNGWREGWSVRLRRCLAEHEGVPSNRIFLSGSGLDFLAMLVPAFGIKKIFYIDGDFPGYTRIAAQFGVEKHAIGVDAATRTVTAGDIAGCVRGAQNAMFALTLPVTNPLQVPTGIELARAAARANPDMLVLVDGAYEKFGESREGAKLAMECPNVCYLQVAAKDLCLSGARLSWIVPSCELAAKIADLLPPYQVSPHSVRQACQLLEAPGILASLRRIQIAARDILSAGVDKLGLGTITGVGPWVLLDFGGHAKQIVAELASRGIFVQLQEHCASLRGWVRISATVPCEAIAIVEAIEHILVGEPSAAAWPPVLARHAENAARAASCDFTVQHNPRERVS